MKVFVDQETCTGCGLCAQTCPEVFEMEDNKAEVLVAVVPVDCYECARRAADECPVVAITIEE